MGSPPPPYNSAARLIWPNWASWNLEFSVCLCWSENFLIIVSLIFHFLHFDTLEHLYRPGIACRIDFWHIETEQTSPEWVRTKNEKWPLCDRRPYSLTRLHETLMLRGLKPVSLCETEWDALCKKSPICVLSQLGGRTHWFSSASTLTVLSKTRAPFAKRFRVPSVFLFKISPPEPSLFNREKRYETIWNDIKRYETIWNDMNDMKRYETIWKKKLEKTIWKESENSDTTLQKRYETEWDCT